MKRYRLLSAMLLSGMCMWMLCGTAFANSSWRWISETRPYDVLPFVVVSTLLIEILGVCLFNGIKEIHKVCFFVSIGNILSFAAPYLFLLIFPDALYTFEQMLEHTPFYTVGLAYLLVTLAVEVPTVYFAFKKSVQNKTRLLFTVIGANVLTTVATSIVERVLCAGTW